MRFILVAKASRKDVANSHAAAVHPLAADAFSLGLSKDGQPPATHYWCGWNLSSPSEEKLRSRLKDELGVGNVQFFAAREYTPDDVLRELGLKRIV